MGAQGGSLQMFSISIAICSSIMRSSRFASSSSSGHGDETQENLPGYEEMRVHGFAQEMNRGATYVTTVRREGVREDEWGFTDYQDVLKKLRGLKIGK